MLIKNTERNVTPLFSTALRLMSVALFLSVGLILLAQPAFAQKGGLTITKDELRHKLESGEKFILIDVREPHEHADFNIGGVVMPLGKLSLLELEHIVEDKDEEIILYCRSGARSRMALIKFEHLGFKNLRHLDGGIMAWQIAFGNFKPEWKQRSETPQQKAPETPPSKTPAPQQKTPATEPNAPNQPKSTKIYVGNLSADTTEETLRNIFAEFGEVKFVKIGKDKNNAPIGFVEMAAGAADEAINQLNESELDGNEIVVRKAKADEGN